MAVLALLSTGINTFITTMAADAPTSTSSNSPEQAKDDSPNVDTPQKTGSPGPTDHISVEQSDSERPQQHDDHLADPQVIALRAIFPDYDDGLL